MYSVGSMSAFSAASRTFVVSPSGSRSIIRGIIGLHDGDVFIITVLLLGHMKSERDEFLKGTRTRIRWAKERGARVTPAQKAFLEEASWQSYRENRLREPHEAMQDPQRKMKLDMMARWRQGLENLRLVEETYRFGGEAWFQLADVAKVLDRDALVDIVRTTIRIFGKQYADAFLQTLQEAYTVDQEEIFILRRPRVLG